MEYFNSLPEEITLDIISRVPTESVLECKLVCTTWRSLIRRASFSKMHFNHSVADVADSGKLGFIALTYFSRGKGNFQYFEYNENQESTPIDRIRRINFSSPPFMGVAMCLGSCNGLICVYEDRYYEGKAYICNPITREIIMIPKIKKFTTNRRASGFGYVSSTKEYKVVTIIFEKETDFIEVYVYTLGSGNERRNLGKFNVGNRTHWKDGTFLNGVIYWWDSFLESIFTFDLASEKFCQQLSPPPLSSSIYEANANLGVFDGCLWFANKRFDGNDYLEVWTMKKTDDNHGTEERVGHQSLGWSEVFMVYDCNMFAVTKNHAVLTYSCTRNHIKIHDLGTSTSKTIVDFKEWFGIIFPHKNTLVSLKELGGEDTKIMESVDVEEKESRDQSFN